MMAVLVVMIMMTMALTPMVLTMMLLTVILTIAVYVWGFCLTYGAAKPSGEDPAVRCCAAVHPFVPLSNRPGNVEESAVPCSSVGDTT